MADELRELVRERRQDMGLSYQSLAAACTEAAAGVSVTAAWLHRLERGQPVIAPSIHTLAALAAGLRLDLPLLKEAAAAEFFGLQTPPEASGEAADLLAAWSGLPEGQRQALVHLVRAMADGQRHRTTSGPSLRD